MSFQFRLRKDGIVQTHWVLDRDGNETGIVTLMLNAPPVNTLTPPLVMGVTNTLKELKEDSKCLGVLFYSNCHKRAKTTKKPVFSPGFDLSIVGSKKNVGRTKEYLYSVSRFLVAIHTFDKPIIGLLIGQCIAGGAVLPCTFDYRILHADKDRTMMHFNEISIGVGISQIIFDSTCTAMTPDVASLIMQQSVALTPQECKKLAIVNELWQPKKEQNNNAMLTNEEIQKEMIEYGINVMQRKYFLSDKFKQDFAKNKTKINAASAARRFSRQKFIDFLRDENGLDKDLNKLLKGFHNDYSQRLIKSFMARSKSKL